MQKFLITIVSFFLIGINVAAGEGVDKNPKKQDSKEDVNLSQQADLKVPEIDKGFLDRSMPVLDKVDYATKALGKEPRLRYREIQAVRLSREWADKHSKPVLGKHGKVIYHFGESLHTVVCSELNVCDVELQPGEMVKGFELGDKVRWQVTPALSGPAENETTHLIIKPIFPKTETTMIVTTDRRTYRFQLKSTSNSKKITHAIAFFYPDEQSRVWAEFYKNQYNKNQKAAARNTITSGVGLKAENLDFNYSFDGDVNIKWRPVRIFNDGVKTYIQMPEAMKQSEAPVFMVSQNGGDIIVNYRLKEDTFIIDRVFDEGFLIAGVGTKQQKIGIYKKGARTAATERENHEH